ncbi:MAG TPA: hypothetical protein VIR58_10025 [Acidimicrobiales bacterium]
MADRARGPATGSPRQRVTDSRLTEADGTTELTLVHHLDADANPADVGPGWEYYLDMLVASREPGSDRPDFDDYYPAQSAHFTAQG